MKKIHTLCLLLLVLNGCLSAQTGALSYTISPWPDDRKAAVSLTFDDGISGQFNIAVPMLNKHHFQASFYVTVSILLGQLGDWRLVQAAAAAGHEIANHSLTHPHFNAILQDSIRRELIESNKQIRAHIPAQQSLTHAYPFGEGGQEGQAERSARAIVKQFFIGARATRNKPLTYNSYDFAKTDDDYFKVNSDMIADSASMAGFGRQLDSTIAAGGWYVPTYHGIVNGWIIVPQNIFENHLEELEKRRQQLWIAPFANVLKYHKERNCAKLKLVKKSRHLLVVQLTDSLSDHKLWDEPLTIHLRINASGVKLITQAATNIPFSFLNGELVFNAVPGDNKILISTR